MVSTRKRKAAKQSAPEPEPEPEPTTAKKRKSSKAKPKAKPKPKPKAKPKAKEPLPAEEPKEKKKEKEKDPKIDWANSAAKQFLKQAFKDGLIPIKYMAKEGGPGPRYIWDNFCEGTAPFNRMTYEGSGFTSRLSGVRDDTLLKVKRKDLDQKAFNNFRKIQPRPTHDHEGVPLWDGSDAQRLLKEDMAKGLHELFQGKERRKKYWLTKEEFQVYKLPVFRDHIYQEEKLWKLHNYLRLEAAKKQKVIKDKPEEVAAAGDNN